MEKTDEGKSCTEYTDIDLQLVPGSPSSVTTIGSEEPIAVTASPRRSLWTLNNNLSLGLICNAARVGGVWIQISIMMGRIIGLRLVVL